MNHNVEEVCRKLRETVKEFGQAAIDNTIIVGSDDTIGDSISGHKYVYAPTVGDFKLASTTYKIARFFESI